MMQTVERSFHSEEIGHLHGAVKVQGVLSDLVIPSVPGEYYSYSSEFTEERPLYALMKCKSNKNRPIVAAGELGHEANLLFLFGSPNLAQVCTIREAHTAGLLGESVNSESFGETWIATAGITAEDFYKLHLRKDMMALVETCHAAFSRARGVSIVLEPRSIIAMMTDRDKYGLFFVKNITRTSIQIDACHILLHPHTAHQ